MTSSVAEAAAKLPFTRLIHFTSDANLLGLFRDGEIRASDDLAALSTAYSAPDPLRIDGQRGHVCCSFEYPNLYYQAKASATPGFVNYPGWVCLVLRRDLILRPETLFAPCNAAKGSGQFLAEGGGALANCWLSPSIPDGWVRTAQHLASVPTDLQAEVLIPGSIPVSDVLAIITDAAERARSVYGFLDAYGLRPDRFEWRYTPVLFNRDSLRKAVHRGQRPVENVWTPNSNGEQS